MGQAESGQYPSMPARLVLSQHIGLHDRLAHPTFEVREFFHSFARLAYEKHDVNSQAMFYPYQPNLSIDEAGRYATHLAYSLFQARTYQVSTPMVAAVTSLYENSTGTYHVQEQELPSEHGFVWLDKPMLLRDVRMNLVAERAFTWSLVPLYYKDRSQHTGVRLSSWTLDGDKDDYTMNREEAMQFTAALGPLVLSHSLVVPFGERHGTFPGSEGSTRPGNSLAWMHALWMFMGTEFAAQERPPLDRHTSKRVLRSIKQGEVSVILLRQAARRSRELPAGNADVDWSCRWLVQGHWRHLGSYTTRQHAALPGRGPLRGQCITCGVAVTWVKPYIKGPDDRPLRATTQLYRVSR